MTIGYTGPQPNLQAAASGNRLELKRMLEFLVSNLQQLQRKNALTSFNSDLQSPVNPPPAFAKVAVRSPLSNTVEVAITNPEYVNPSHNPLRTPIFHQVRYAKTQGMNGATPLPIGTQVHYNLPLSGRYFIGVKSSLDGTTFNQEQVFEVHA